MRRRFLLLAAAVTLAAAQTPARAPERGAAGGQEAPAAARWERLTFPGEEFSVEWPDMPFVFATSRPVKERDREYEKLLYFGAYSDGVIFRLASFHNPRPHETLADFGARLSARDPLAETGTREVAAGGVKGVEFDIRGGTARVFRTPKRVYVLEAFSRGGDHDGVARFLNSLTLGANPRGRAIEAGAFEAKLAPPSAQAPPAAPDAAPAGPLSARDVPQKAVVVFKPEPGFTEQARQNNVYGLVRLRAVFASTGKVTNIQVIKGLPDGLTEKAIVAARCIQFFPAEKDGRRVSQYVTLEYNFNIY
jgi:TonB family protein